MAEPEWTVVFYTDPGGSRPVNEFLGKLDGKTEVRFLRAIEQLRQRNVLAREPLVRHLEGKLWELREVNNSNAYRLLYFFFTGPAHRFRPWVPKEDAEDAP